MKGDDEATAGEDNPGILVLHFTYRSIRYVRSDGKEEE
jgi:general stress protein 26